MTKIFLDFPSDSKHDTPTNDQLLQYFSDKFVEADPRPIKKFGAVAVNVFNTKALVR